MPDSTPQPLALSHRDIRFILSGTLLGMFLGAIDGTIVATALPAIAGELHGMAHMSWTVSAYLLTATASTPIYGKLSDVYGRRALFTAAIVIFLLGSIWCGFAPDMGQLIAARTAQGIGGGGLMSLAMTIVADILPPRERGRYQAYFSVNWFAATVGGPILGGFFVDALSWRWVFWINIPIGIIALLICNRALLRLPAHHRGRAVRPRIDFLGAALLMPAIVALLLVSSWGGVELPWTSPAIWLLAALGLILTLLFALQELRAPDPILPPRLFRSSVFVVCNALAFLSGAGSFGAVIFLPLFLQVVIGASASNSGLLIAPMMVGMTTAGFVAGHAIRITGRYKIFPIAGGFIAAIAFVLFAWVNPATPAWLYGIAMGALGLGLGAGGPTVVLGVQNVVDVRDLGTATSAVAFFRSMGGSFGVAILGAILFAGVAKPEGPGQSVNVGGLLHGGPAMMATLPDAVRQGIVDSFARSFRVVYFVGAGITALSAVLGFLLKEVPLRSGAAPREAETPARRPAS
jgi:EmrB/QacA subfamily drug resistance transporter